MSTAFAAGPQPPVPAPGSAEERAQDMLKAQFNSLQPSPKPTPLLPSSQEPITPASLAAAASIPESRWPYGCWFWPVRGSGVYVNVGRSLRVATRADAHAALGLPCAKEHQPDCDANPR
eukprot:3874662-Prymnesium_polylepis.1